MRIPAIENAIMQWCEHKDFDTGKCRLRDTRYDNCRCEQQANSVGEIALKEYNKAINKGAAALKNALLDIKPLK